MEVRSSKEQLELAYELFKGLRQDNLGYIYRGLLTQKLTVSILSLTESNMSKFEDATKVKKKVFFIMMEGLQNITRHQDAERDTTPEKYGIFVFQKRATRYYITTGNLIDKTKTAALGKQLDKINSLEQEELKQYKKEMLITGHISDRGGAGLGLIEMARKSGRKLMYDFKDINDEFSYFYLHIDVPFVEETPEQEKKASEFSTEAIKELHAKFNEENVLLNFSGIFTQDNLMDLLSIFEGQMKGRVLLKKKVFNIMVEMLQNLVKHADNPEEDDDGGKPGIFFISEKDNKFFINCANFIRNDHIKTLQDKIDFANSMSLDECNDYYNRILSNFKIDDPTTSGLGVIDMRLKSENKIYYKLNKIDDNHSFVTLQTCV